MHWAVENYKSKHPDKIPHVITTNIEHCATELPLKQWEKDGRIEVTFVPVNTSTGRVDLSQIQQSIRSNTCLITVMLANNETGVIQPISEICKMLTEMKNRDIFVHSDAAQAFGKIPVSIKDYPVDYMTIVGHKFYGPRIGKVRFKHFMFTNCSIGDAEQANFRFF